MIHDVKVKHIDRILGGSKSMVSPFELLEVKNTFWNRIKYKDSLYIFNYNLIEFLNTDVTLLEPVPCEIKIPSNVENIPFSAWLSAQSILASESRTPAESIRDLIASVCYDANDIKEDELKEIVMEVSFRDAMGIYNWIKKSIRASQLEWEKRFLSVYVADKDYDQAGGHVMNQFNVITTIKNTCNDFNIPYEEAWLLPYSVVQTNSYAKATQAHVQSKMEDIKTARMKAQRKNPK